MGILSTSRGWKTELRKFSQSTSLAKKSYQRWRNFKFPIPLPQKSRFSPDITHVCSKKEENNTAWTNLRCVDQNLRVAPNRPVFCIWGDFRYPNRSVHHSLPSNYRTTSPKIISNMSPKKGTISKRKRYTISQPSFLRGRAFYFPSVFLLFLGRGKEGKGTTLRGLFELCDGHRSRFAIRASRDTTPILREWWGQRPWPVWWLRDLPV